MMDRTDRHCRYLLRLISRHALLYTEMVTVGALLHGDRERLLDFHPAEHPVALQLGGSEPREMAQCARYGEQAGYDEININAGCPSNRVQAGRFGACLMAEPVRVADCVAAMRAAVAIPVTVKTRIGIDNQDSYEALARFVGIVAQAGCGTFIVHARKAWLTGLNPRQNREVPPLCYETVHRLKRQFPQLEIILNGGFTSLAQAHAQLAQVDGVMLGRGVYQNPYLLAGVDRLFYGDKHPSFTRERILARYFPYIETQLRQGIPLGRITRHLTSLFQGRHGARVFRRYLSENAHKPAAGVEVVRTAAALVVHGQADAA